MSAGTRPVGRIDRSDRWGPDRSRRVSIIVIGYTITGRTWTSRKSVSGPPCSSSGPWRWPGLPHSPPDRLRISWPGRRCSWRSFAVVRPVAAPATDV